MPRDLSTTGLLESRRGIFRLGMTFGVAPYRVRRPPLGLAKNKSRKCNGMRFFSLHGRVCYRFTPPRRLFYSLGLEKFSCTHLHCWWDTLVLYSAQPPTTTTNPSVLLCYMAMGSLPVTIDRLRYWINCYTCPSITTNW
jgi:hypothetical protein